MSIKVKYAGFWKGFNYTSEPLIYQYLANKYDIKVVETNPDICFIGRKGNAYKLEKQGIKVFYSAERYDFKREYFDWSISYQPDDDKNLFLQNYIRKYGF